MTNADFKKFVFSNEFKAMYKSLPEALRRSVRHQIPRCGSGGSGNHFCEIQRDSNGVIWFMLHFGSRNLGQQVGRFYNNLAKELNQQWHSSVPVKHDLAFLPLETEEGQAYIKAMNLCLTYAKFNHAIAAEKIAGIFGKICGTRVVERYFVHHNYANVENHFGSNVVIHRKGATSARQGEIGIIPGSQGTASYIVAGKGNPESFHSCSHGAGRKMGRKEAQRSLNLEEEKAKLDKRGILHAIRGMKDLDEAAGAYKDINVVMSEQLDLIEILVKLEPLAVIKG